jgi:hypothetical protein
LPGPVDQNVEILGLLAQRLGELALVLEPTPALEYPLGGGLILPEVGSG